MGARGQMAAKVTVQDIEDAGFAPAQFGSPLDWSVDGTGYLARVIARASLWAHGAFGLAYDAVPENSPAFEHLRAAELCWVRAELWRRRAAFIDSNAVSAMDNLVHADRREFEAQAARAWECAQDAMALATGGGPRGSGLGFAAVETGPFAGACIGGARCV